MSQEQQTMAVKGFVQLPLDRYEQLAKAEKDLRLIQERHNLKEYRRKELVEDLLKLKPLQSGVEIVGKTLFVSLNEKKLLEFLGVDNLIKDYVVENDINMSYVETLVIPMDYDDKMEYLKQLKL